MEMAGRLFTVKNGFHVEKIKDQGFLSPPPVKTHVCLT